MHTELIGRTLTAFNTSAENRRKNSWKADQHPFIQSWKTQPRKWYDHSQFKTWQPLSIITLISGKRASQGGRPLMLVRAKPSCHCLNSS
jgi:hypothetical protein